MRTQRAGAGDRRSTRVRSLDARLFLEVEDPHEPKFFRHGLGWFSTWQCLVGDPGGCVDSSPRPSPRLARRGGQIGAPGAAIVLITTNASCDSRCRVQCAKFSGTYLRTATTVRPLPPRTAATSLAVLHSNFSPKKVDRFRRCARLHMCFR
jgi:hypothetical protein